MAKKGKQTLTKLQKGLKKVFRKGGARGATVLPVITELRKLGPLFTPSAPANNQQQQQQQQQPAQPHAKKGQASQAVLCKKKGYAQKGSNFIRGASGRGVYKSFGHLTGFRSPQVIAGIVETCSFPGTRAENFDPGAKDSAGKNAGQRYPYKWEAHHIIPGSALYLEVKPNQPVFTADQFEILLQSKYDINNGHNIIMLPDAEDESVYIHCLIAHPSDHRNYTKWVMDELVKIADAIQELQDGAQPHDDIVKAFEKELENKEEGGWKQIVTISKAVVGASLAGLPVDDGAMNEGMRLT